MRFGRHPALFARLSSKDRLRLVGAASRRRVGKGEVVFQQGDPHDVIFVIDSGRMRLTYCAEDGRNVTFAYWGTGAMVGSPAVHSHMWTGEAVEPTELLCIGRAAFLALLSESPGLALATLESMEFKCGAMAEFVQILATTKLSERLQLFLRGLMETHGERMAGGIAIRVPLAHREIAELVAASRQRVTLELGRLQAMGVLRIGNRRITILRPEFFQKLPPRAA